MRVAILCAAGALSSLAMLAGCDGDGTRGACASGTGLRCPATVTTAAEACSRLVSCASIPLASDDDDVFDWGRCADQLERLTDDRARLIIACVAASSCEELRTDGSPHNPYGDIYCFELGTP
jgi:hypothetical protein